MAAPAAVLSILVKANTGQATTGLIRVNQQLQDTHARAGKLAGAFRVAEKAVGVAALGLGGALAYSAKKAADFEQQLSALGAVTDANGEDMDMFRRQALKAGADTKFSALEAAEAQTELAKGGLKIEQIMKGGLRSALALAAAGEMELADAAASTVRAMKLFGIRGRDSMKVADAFASAANRTTADVADFAMALTQGGAAARAAGLDFNETVAALEALAEIGIRNSDAGTSLKAALTQLARPTERAQATMDKLGLSFFDAHGNMKDVAEISGMLQARLGDLTKEQRLQAITNVVGTDGMRALLALYEAGPAKIRGFEKAQKQQGVAADVARKKQDNLKGSLEQLRGSVETLGISVGTLMIPAIRKGADEARKFADTVGKIAQRDDLSVGEKLSRSFEALKIQAGPWVAEFKRALAELDIPKLIADAISAATPVIVQAMVKLAASAAQGFARAFTEADVWGKLVLGGWLLSRMGGLGAFVLMGRRAGGAFGAGMATGAGGAAAGGAAAGVGSGVAAGVGAGLMGKVKGVAKGVGGFAKRAAVLDFAINLVDSKGNPLRAAVNTAHDLTFGIVPKITKDVGAENLSAFQKQIKSLGNAGDVAGLQAIGRELDHFSKFDAPGGIVQARKDLAAMLEVARDTAPIRGVAINVGRGSLALTRYSQDLTESKQRLGGLKRGSTEYVDAAQHVRRAQNGVNDSLIDMLPVSAQAKGAVRGLGINFKGLGGTVADTASYITAATNQVLSGLGADTIKFSLKRSRQIGQGRPVSSSPNSGAGQQRGGPINVGASSGDTVPAMLERGEYVMNRKAVAKVGRKALDAVNFGAAPRFRKGGAVGERVAKQEVVGPAGPMRDIATGAESKMRSAANEKIAKRAAEVAAVAAPRGGAGDVHGLVPQVLRALAWARKHGWRGTVSSGYRSVSEQQYLWDNATALGLVRGKTVAAPGSSSHNFGEAVDITDIPGFARAMASAPANSRLRALVANDPVHFSVSGRKLGGLVEKLIDGGAVRALQSRGGSTRRQTGGSVEAVFARVAKQVSKSPVATRALGMAGYAESGMRDLGYGDASSEGPLQLLSSTAAGLGISPHNVAGVARLFFQRGFYGKGGANALAAKGLPAYMVAQSVQGSATASGSNYKAQESKANAWMKRFGLMKAGAAAGTGRAKAGAGAGKGPEPGDLGKVGKPTSGANIKLRKWFKVLAHAKSKRARVTVQNKLLTKIAAIGLPHGLVGQALRGGRQADVFGEYANRASQLTDTEAIQKTLETEFANRGGKFNDADQAAVVEQMQGRVNGTTQLGWLQKQRDALFVWRNRLVDVFTKIQQRRERVTAMIREARETLEKIEDTDKTRQTLARQLKHTKGPAKIARLKARIAEIDKDAPRRERVRKSLVGPNGIISALSKKNADLGGARSQVTENLNPLQGLGSPMTPLKVLPELGQAGSLGGTIFDTQVAIRDLIAGNQTIRAATDSTAGGGDDSELKGLLEEWKRLGGLRDTVRTLQADVFAHMPQFATGGIVPGATGTAVPAVVHAGEGVFTREQMAAIGGSTVTVNVAPGMEWLKQFINVQVDTQTRRSARTGARRLPGQGGGIRG